MADTNTKPRARIAPKLARPPLHKVILVNDDFTPREFVVRVLKAEFRVTEDQAHHIMVTAHTKGSCLVAVFTHFEPRVPLEWAIIGLVFCSAVGIGFGMLPAIRASRLDPIEALRYE